MGDIKVNIFYSNNTLFVNLVDFIDDSSVNKLKSRVFGILDDYDIENIVLNIISSDKNNILLDDFIREYRLKYHGNILVK